jgi:hypothetical protein
MFGLVVLKLLLGTVLPAGPSPRTLTATAAH